MLIRNETTFSATAATPTPPTFAQFVRFLLATPPADDDPHWMPYWLHCSPCSVDYDAVVKIETSERDMKELYKMAPVLR